MALDDDRLEKTREIQAVERELAIHLARTPYLLLLACPGVNVVSAAELGGEMGLPALYLLSIGPAAVMAVRGSLNEHTYSVIYSPLQAVCDRWRPASRAVNWYGRLWLRASGE